MGDALMARHAIERSLSKAQKYKRSLGAGKTAGKFPDAKTKFKWMLFERREASRLHNYINLHVNRVHAMFVTASLDHSN